MTRKLFVALLSFVLVNATYAQVKTDTTKANEATDLLIRIDSVRIADSLKRLTLLDEIENLKSTETAKREKLLQQLKEEERKDSIRDVKLQQELAQLKSSAKGSPVAPFADTLFYVYTKVGSFSARERAEAIARKIENLFDDYTFVPDSLSIHPNETTTDIVYRDLVVMSVNEMEAMWYGVNRDHLANDHHDKIVQAIKTERDSWSLLNILIRVGEVILILVGIYLLILLINKLFKRLRLKVVSLKNSILKGIRFRGYQFMDSDREVRLILFLLNVLRWLLIALALYFMLPLLFSIFPWTEGIATTMLNWVLNPIGKLVSGIIAYLPNLFTILVIGGVTHYAVKFLRFVADEIQSGALSIPGFYPDWAVPTFTLVRVLIYAFSFIIIFPYLPGSESPIFQGVSVFLGILFSLGSSSAISNAVAGFVITYMRPFKVGDRIKIGDITGDVVEKSLLVTRVRTIKNEDITIPNATVLSGHTINYTTSAKELGLILHTGVTIGYDVPWKQVHGLLIDAARATNGIMNDDNHKPFVLQTSLDDFYVAYQINAYTEQSHRMAAIYSELHQNIQDKFNEAGVEILSPHYRAARDGNMTTIPANYLPKDYETPGFNVNMKNANKEKL